MNKLFLIPARGGSKGLPGKNIKILNGKPLINHAVDFARNFTTDSNICVSSDCDEIIKCVEKNNLKVHFKRPSVLASDTASTMQVIKHAISYYESKGKSFDLLVLLQPTTPFRKVQDLTKMLNKWNNDLDLLVSVKKSHDSPYFNIFEEGSDGYLHISKDLNITRRQDAPEVFAFNGSIYLYNIESVRLNRIKSIKKYVMEDPIYSIDIDTSFDLMLCETVLTKNLF